MQFLFPRHNNRITTPSQFRLLYASAKRAFSKNVTVFYAPSSDGNSRMAFVASKKVGGSVVRNRCKRLIKEAVRLNQNHISRCYDYVFVAKAELGHKGLNEMERDLGFLFRKHSLWI